MQKEKAISAARKALEMRRALQIVPIFTDVLGISGLTVKEIHLHSVFAAFPGFWPIPGMPGNLQKLML
jgi:hypothetical protein